MEETKQYPDLSSAEPFEIAKEAGVLLLKKQGRDLKFYRVSDTTVITDYYLIVTGRSSTHVKALADEMDAEMAKRGIPAARIEGRDGASWILVDFGCVIVHIFDRASREYYHLERLLRSEDEIGTEDLEALADEDPA
jgi:ribosome-associated protein